ncbi:MAG: flagellar protein FliS [Anaerolineae bacterium]|nr:flagellar protein FliS [Anaerolineae bacterium]
MSNLLATQTYRANQVNGASPLDLLLMTYDAALIGCGQNNLSRTINALNLLRDSLDFSYDQEIALGFFRLYQYCADLARKGEFDEVATILRELRDAWAQVKEQYNPAQSLNNIAPSASPQQTPILAQLITAV